MAVGDAHTPTTPPHPVSYLYNGTSWRNIAMPNPGKISTHTYSAQLDAVTVVPGSLGKKFWAVGTYSNGLNTMPFFDLWNGLSWKQYKLAQSVQAFLNAHTTTHYPTPLSSVIASVTAGAANNVWAVGYYIVNHTAPTPSSNHTFAAHWNGTSWSMVLTPDRVSDATPNELSGVAGRMVSGKFVIYAVGRYFATPFDQTQVLQWDTATVPPSWLKITSANDTTNHNSLEGIAMLPGTGAVSVGTWFSGTSDRTLVETCASC
jgi:hypothetical protein